MGRQICVIEEKVLLNCFTESPMFFFYFLFFLLAAQVLLKIKVSVEPCLVSVVLMRGCSGTGEYEAGKEKNHSILTTKNQTTPLGSR